MAWTRFTHYLPFLGFDVSLLLVKQKLFNKQLGRIVSDFRRHDTFLAAHCRDKWIEIFLISIMHDMLGSGILSPRRNSHVIRVLKIIYSLSGLHSYLWGAPFLCKCNNLSLSYNQLSCSTVGSPSSLENLRTASLLTIWNVPNLRSLHVCVVTNHI